MSERRERAIRYLKQHCPDAKHTIRVLERGACWIDIHRAVQMDVIIKPWAKFIASRNGDAEACMELLTCSSISLKVLPPTAHVALVSRAAKSAQCSYKTMLNCYDKLSVIERMLLIRGITQDPARACELMYLCNDLSRNERGVLIVCIAKNPQNANDLLGIADDLTRTERSLLIRGVLQSIEESYMLRADFSIKLSAKEKLALTTKVSGIPKDAYNLRLECTNLSTKERMLLTRRIATDYDLVRRLLTYAEDLSKAERSILNAAA